MLRRNARLRQEYLYRKGLESKEREEHEKKEEIKRALQDGQRVPGHLRDEARKLMHSSEMDDAHTAQLRTHVDDEYLTAGVSDPKLMLTTSRAPSSRLQSFAKEMKLVFPNCERVNRGTLVMKEMVTMCRANDVTDLIILHENKGEPNGMIVCHLPYGPTAYFGLSQTVMRHDVRPERNMSLAYPHLIFNNLSTKLGERVQNILRYLFPVPKADSRRVMTFSNNADVISFRHHLYTKKGHHEGDIELEELGPRFEMRLYQLRLGTVDQPHAESEWVLRPFLNSAKRRRYL